MGRPVKQRVEAILSNVRFLDYTFVLHMHGADTLQLFGEYVEPDTYSGVPETQRTRRWNITPQMTDSEIVQTAFKLCLTSMEHRAREGFSYRGARVYGPHFDVNDLVELCQRGLENAGGRAP